MDDTSEQRPNRRLVLCFDGTGNSFQGTETDTNIVKLYGLMDRRDPQQFHYYQPGIGTYSEHEDGGILQYWSALKASISKTIDQGVGTKFKDHVLAGYRFLMRYYEDGDDIYVFGFSRGAYTARFLSQMIFRVGLLSRGNEEMIHFAWKAFSDWLHVVGEDTPQDRERRAHMEKFQSTFCRENVQVLFLGLFDCVNSVGQFEMPLFSSTYKHMPLPPAKHIRHAVSISERRLKFKPALFSAELHQPSEDVKEVWFAGNHADVGGGWERVPGQPALLSDEPLQWMIDEVLNLPVQEPIALTSKKYIRAEQTLEEKRAASSGFAMFKHTKSRKELRRETMRPHDMLRFGGGVGFGAVCSWWIFEVLPFFSRLELEFGKWIPRHWPPNLGAARDLPDNAILHESVHRLHKAGVISSLPRLGGDGPPKLSGAATALYNFSILNATANEQSTPGDDAARASVHPSRKSSSDGSE